MYFRNASKMMERKLQEPSRLTEQFQSRHAHFSSVNLVEASLILLTNTSPRIAHCQIHGGRTEQELFKTMNRTREGECFKREMPAKVKVHYEESR